MISPHADALRLALSGDPMTARHPLARQRRRAHRRQAIIQYALRDTARGLDEIPVYRVSAEGTLRRLGMLVPVWQEGFVMQQEPQFEA